MQKIIDYLNNPDNRTYIIVLSVSLVLLILLCAIVVYFYKRKNSKTVGTNDAPPAEPLKEMPEDIVDTFENISEQTSDALDDNISDNTEIDIASVLNDTETSDNGDKSDDKTETTRNGDTSRPGGDAAALDNSVVFAEPTATANGSDISVAEQNSDNSQQKYIGKWVISTDTDGKLFACLKASNGDKMLTTESYSSLSGLKSGIDTLKKNIEKDNYAISLDKDGNFVFKIYTSANRVLCVGEGHSTREQCRKAFASVKRFSETAVIVNNATKNAK